ncbi:hypothetical protein V8E53_010559 [Lactarius tabidus]
MFGESESESPRVPSPWDVVLSSSAPIDKVHYHQEEPKLAAEVEEGNVEYKLHLINPSPTRFVRLVTQMKWRLLEGGGQAIYELGVADSGALVGLTSSDLRATLNTLRAMAAEIGARVIIAKEIEVVGTSDSSLAAAGFGSPPHKQNGSKENQRMAVKNLPRFQTSLADSDSSPRSFVSATSMTTSSSVDSTDSHSSVPISSPPSALPSAGPIEIPLGDHETVHDDVSLFPMLTLDEPHQLAHGLANGKEILVSPGQPGAITVPKSPIIKIHGGHTSPRVRTVQRNLEAESQFVHDNGLNESDELLLTALGKLDLADSSRVPEQGKRMIVEAMIVRELDQEEGFLDFSSF